MLPPLCGFERSIQNYRRRKVPLLEPETTYELYGQVNNVVFPCGAVVIGEDLFVYYGGADSAIVWRQ